MKRVNWTVINLVLYGICIFTFIQDKNWQAVFGFLCAYIYAWLYLNSKEK